MFDELEVFKGKSFSGLLKDIYKNSAEKEKQIKILIGELRPLIKNIGDATIIVPLIKEYMEIGVKNDEQLVKMAAVVQRAVAANKSSDSNEFLLSDEEKKQLLDEINKFEDTDDDFDKDLESTLNKADEAIKNGK
tara:strand:- start:76 stop:480 length:405 start_codon:yes stop_codon:yes gene_type:complete